MSSSSNDSRFQVTLRGVSADLTELGPQVEAQDLGELGAPELVDLLSRFVAIDPLRLIDAEPQILLVGRRGRFIARVARGKLLLQAAGDAAGAFIELAVADAPLWLDQPEGSIHLPEPATPPAPEIVPSSSRLGQRRGLVIGFLAVSLVALGLSIHFTFQPRAVHPNSEFSPIADQAEQTRLQQQLPGRYVTSDGSSELIVAPDGSLTYVEVGRTAENTERTLDHYVLRNMTGRGPVLKADTLGPIVIHDARTLVFNGENYTLR